MVPEDLLFWIAPLPGTPLEDQNVLCRRHADALTVPRGWTLDDRREEFPRLFKPNPVARPVPATPAVPRPRRAKEPVEQLVIDGTGEIERPSQVSANHATTTADSDPAAPWSPTFDHDSDLDGLLEVKSPLLARAFRGADRPRS